jgi:orotidine-5'-phosphate decarboxylase
MDFVRELVAHGKQVFLDLKLYDIGETVKRAVAQIARVPGIRLLTVHAMKPVMLAAVAGRGESPLRLLGVTVLTSFDENDLREMGYRTSVKDLVELRVRHAIEAGMDGVVCSPLEVAAVRAAMGPKAVLVTPGVRSAGAAAGDQKRVASPTDALRSGASHLVIGRQVTRAADPRAELRRMLAEIAAV